MSASIFQNRDAYLQNTYFQTHKREYGDFTSFYITVSICTLFFIFLIVLNVTLGCCSRYSDYWIDRHTGNRWIVSLWTATPHNQPSLDYTELEHVIVSKDRELDDLSLSETPLTTPTPPFISSLPPPEYTKAAEALELQQQKRESAI